MDIQQLFRLGMKRDVPVLLEPSPDLPVIDLGAGNNPVEGADILDLPDWDVMKDDIPYSDESVGGIYAFHFMEHVPGDRVIYLLREIERVLVPGGVLTCGTPHYTSCLAFRDLDHKSFWSLETWRQTLGNPYYAKHSPKGWKLKVHANFVMGVEEPNLALFTQLIRTV